MREFTDIAEKTAASDDAFSTQHRDERATSAKTIELICAEARRRPNEPLTLTEMESLSGLPRRTIHYAFTKRFGCSPLRWQQEERLRTAFRRLSESGGAASITGLSNDLGFSSPSRFAGYYRRIFGETPRETLQRSRSIKSDAPLRPIHLQATSVS